MRARPDLSARNRANAKHGGCADGVETGAYRSWVNLMKRVRGTSTPHDLPSYFWRGIGVCERWLDFANFRADMGERPPGATIDRIDNSKDYEPGNCRWATRVEQARNRRSSRLLEWNGLTLSTAEWAERTGIERHTIGFRIRNGWSVADALTVKPTKANRWRAK